ncbi:hypothetical protein C8Q73DRAFT_793112 [Cubamyces lactineus]|nr:hypothetical protein C8Q73DRAFT_793112 [Cubamyces lactineus]
MDILLNSRIFAVAQDSPELLRRVGVVDADGRVASDSLTVIDRYLSALSRNKLALESKVTQLRREQNSNLPINTLPTNILTNIFSLASRDIEDKTLQLVALSQVCSSWRTIVVEFPSLWNTFSVVHRKTTELHLVRSGSLPLYIVVDKPDASAESVMAILAPVFLQIHRVKSLNIASWNSASLVGILTRFQQWNEPDLPLQLTNLSLTGTITPEGEDPGHGVPPFSFEAKLGKHVYQLRSLTLNNVKMNTLLRRSHTYALRRLELAFQKSSQIPTSSLLTRFLNQCPMLELLSLKTTAPIEYVAVNHNHLRPLSHLNRVVIEGVSAGTVHAFSQILSSILPSGRSQDSPPLRRPYVDLIMDGNVTCAEGWLYDDNPPPTFPQHLVHPAGLRFLVVTGSADGSLILHGFYDNIGPIPDVRFVFQGNKDEPGLHHLSLVAWPINVLDVEVVYFVYDAEIGAGIPPDGENCTMLLAQMPALTEVQTRDADWPANKALFVAAKCLARAGDGDDDECLLPRWSKITMLHTPWGDINYTEALAPYVDARDEDSCIEINTELRGVQDWSYVEWVVFKVDLIEHKFIVELI